MPNLNANLNKSNQLELLKNKYFIFFKLKSKHDYFKSYLNKVPDSYLNIYFIYNIKKNPKYLLLHCKKYSSIKNKIKAKKQLN